MYSVIYSTKSEDKEYDLCATSLLSVLSELVLRTSLQPGNPIIFFFASTNVKLGPKTWLLRPHFLFGTHRPVGFRQPPKRHFQSNIFKTSTQLRFKELHPLLLVSIPFQTNKINIRLGVKSLLDLILHPRGE